MSNHKKQSKQNIALMLEKLDSILTLPCSDTLKKEQYVDLKRVSALVKQTKIEAGLMSIKNQLHAIQVQALSADEMFEKMSDIESKIEGIFNTARSSMKKMQTVEQDNIKRNSTMNG